MSENTLRTQAISYERFIEIMSGKQGRKVRLDNKAALAWAKNGATNGCGAMFAMAGCPVLLLLGLVSPLFLPWPVLPLCVVLAFVSLKCSVALARKAAWRVILGGGGLPLEARREMYAFAVERNILSSTYDFSDQMAEIKASGPGASNF